MADGVESKPPVILATVLDTEDARGLAEFYRELFGLTYRPGDGPPPAGQPDPQGQEWLVLVDPNGSPVLHRRQGADPLLDGVLGLTARPAGPRMRADSRRPPR